MSGTFNNHHGTPDGKPPMNPHKPFKLGNFVKSPVYGIEGIATVLYHNDESRIPQVLIQPYSDDPTKVADGSYIDENLVDYVGEGFVDRMIPPVHNPYNYGDKIKDKISGLEGIVTGWMIMMNGCIDIRLTPNNLDKDGKYIESCMFPISRIVLSEESVKYNSVVIEKIDIVENSDAIRKAKKERKTFTEKAKNLLYGNEVGTTEPATRPLRNTGAAMHKGQNLNRK